jgi:transcriptional regulator with XRE-family HTH domain
MSEKILDGINIGSILEKEFRKSKISFKELAIKLNCSVNTIYTIFKHESIDIERLISFSEILGVDFIRTIFWREQANCKGMCLINKMLDYIEDPNKSALDFNHDIDIGLRIRECLKGKKISLLDFEEMLGCDISKVRAILDHKNIDIKLLINISIILKVDFINQLYYKHRTFNSAVDMPVIKNAIEVAEEDIRMFATNPLVKISDYKIGK